MQSLDGMGTNYNQEQLIEYLSTNPLISPNVLTAFSHIPRHHFVDATFSHRAYEDITLPIGSDQTISQPSVVAIMTTLLDISQANLKILEIGTGSGFQAAILSCFTKRLFTIERHRPLLEKARTQHQSLNIHNIIYKVGDGTMGWADQGPFDRIIVTAGAPSVPSTLLRQLSIGGKLVIPTGDRDDQYLEVYERFEDRIQRQRYNHVQFVPLIGAKGWERISE